jgi:hypothetical protein
MLDLVTNSFLSKLASHEYHASKPIPPEAKRKYGLKKERREYEAEKPVPTEVAEDLGLEKEHHKEAEAAFMGALLTKLARPIPPIASSAYRMDRTDRTGGRSDRGRQDYRRTERQDDRRSEDRYRDRESDRRSDRTRSGLSASDVADIVNRMDRKKLKDKKQSRGFSQAQDFPQIPQAIPKDIVVDIPSSGGPSALGRMATFGGAGALANLLLGDETKSKQERAIKGALIGAGLGGLYHLLRK